MKTVVLVLLAFFLSTSYGYAQSADVSKGVAVAKAAANANVAKGEKIDYEALYSKVPEIREINKQIYEARKAGKPIDDLLKKKAEAIKKVEAQGGLENIK